MEITYRFVLLSFAHPESGIVTEPPVHPYLTRGRQIMIETNHSPIISQFEANDKTTKCEVRFSILTNEGDFIKLLGRKESMENLTSPEPEVQAAPNAIPADQVAAVQNAFNIIKQAGLVSDESQPTEKPSEEEPIIIQNQSDESFDDVEPF